MVGIRVDAGGRAAPRPPHLLAPHLGGSLLAALPRPGIRAVRAHAGGARRRACWLLLASSCLQGGWVGGGGRCGGRAAWPAWQQGQRAVAPAAQLRVTSCPPAHRPPRRWTPTCTCTWSRRWGRVRACRQARGRAGEWQPPVRAFHSVLLTCDAPCAACHPPPAGEEGPSRWPSVLRVLHGLHMSMPHFKDTHVQARLRAAGHCSGAALLVRGQV